MNQEPLCVLVGTTASGKKKVGVRVAEKINAEIISLDSIKVYQGMDIGSAKPDKEDQKKARFHLLDILDPKDSYSVGQFLALAAEKAAEIRSRNKRVLFLGGTAFYLNCLVNGLIKGVDFDPGIRSRLQNRISETGPQQLHTELEKIDPQAAAKIHPNDSKRIVRALEVIEMTGAPLSKLQKEKTHKFFNEPFRIAGLIRRHDELDARIRKRTQRMIDLGFVEEVRAILDGGGFGLESAKAIGYRQIISFLKGERSLKEAIERINITTRQYSKKQMTWYKRFEDIQWFEVNQNTGLPELASKVISFYLGG